MDQAKENNQLYSSDELFQAQSHLNRHILSYMNSVSIKCAVHLGIFDAINGHGKPITHSDLVSSLHIKPAKSGSLRRLIRLLVHSGFITATKSVQEEEEEEYYYDLTLPSRLLLNNKTMPCLSPCVMAFTHRAFVSASLLLGDWFRHADDAATTPFATANDGKEIWECWGEDGEFGGLFDKAMAGDSAMMRFVVKDLGPVFEGVSSLVDVGGGTGTVARIVAGAFPGMTCTVLDLPHVVADLPESSSDENLKFVAGDMFQDIPAADAILFKLTLHAFSDEECLKVLKKCKKSIPRNGGKVIIIDVVINEEKDERDQTEGKLYFDLILMIGTTGRERHEKDWEKLFLEAGFSHYKITHLWV